MRKKGISPVIASIILIAVAIVIGIAIAGLSFHAYSTYTTTSNVSVKEAALFENGTLSITIHNAGSGKATLTNVRGGDLHILPRPGNTGWLGNTNDLLGNDDGTIEAVVVQPIDVLRVYTFVVDLSGGASLVFSLTAQG